jgi:hypothetical protein
MSNEKINPPQAPTNPYHYIQKDISYRNKTDGINIFQNLTMPCHVDIIATKDKI